MTSFQYSPAMAQSHYEPFQQDPFVENPPTSLPFTTSGLPETYSTALSTMDNYGSLGAFSEPSRPYDHGGYFLDASSGAINNSLLAYSPHSPAEHLAPPRLSASSESGTSVQSTSSSSMGSPHMQPQYQPDGWTVPIPGASFSVEQDPQRDMYFTTVEHDPTKTTSFVDPSILNGFTSPPIQFTAYPDPASPQLFEPQPTSPPLHASSTAGKVKKSPRQSPYQPYHPYSYPQQRRQSTSSSMSRNSSQRSGSFELDEHDRERGVCPIPECGKSFKDLKAHMLTHQTERPEKCPIATCEYHTKGFARKYDKNRHTLTHYKGTMVCGFCPGSGSSAEKSFNRADVFKRHLTSVHGVEQVPPNARRKSPTSRKNAGQNQVSGTCSTCSVTFPSAQEFYEHLDDCVLRVVQQIDPAEAINQKHLSTIAEDKEVQDTLEKHNLSSDFTDSAFDEEDEEEDDDDEDGRRKGGNKKKADQSGAGTSWHSNGRVSKKGRPGLTLSKGGVRLNGAAISGRKKRKNYPTSWGSSPDKMKMKKRVLCIYDGQRRLWKDDLMLDSEYEVRVPLPSSGYVTDLDVQTMRRAEAIFSATEDERGPWVPDNIVEAEPEGVVLA